MSSHLINVLFCEYAHSSAESNKKREHRRCERFTDRQTYIRGSENLSIAFHRDKNADEGSVDFNCGNVLIVPHHLSSLVMFSNHFRPGFFPHIRDFISHAHSTTLWPFIFFYCLIRMDREKKDNKTKLCKILLKNILKFHHWHACRVCVGDV